MLLLQAAANSQDYGVDDILFSLVAQVGAIIASVVGAYAVLHRKTREELKGIRQEVATNHGLRAGEYLEMIADVSEDMSKARIDMAELKVLFAEHQSQDDANFAAVRRGIQSLREDMTDGD